MMMTSLPTQIQTIIQRKNLSKDDTKQNKCNLLQYDENLYYSCYIIGINEKNKICILKLLIKIK
jgi:hypothetical protein